MHVQYLYLPRRLLGGCPWDETYVQEVHREVEGGGWEGPREQDLGKWWWGSQNSSVYPGWCHHTAGLWGKVCWLWGQLTPWETQDVADNKLVRSQNLQCRAQLCTPAIFLKSSHPFWLTQPFLSKEGTRFIHITTTDSISFLFLVELKKKGILIHICVI